jgi:UDP-N-acetylglucosamine--N-acetylmuramyl-(pentapeptide) pyrophosphoryl-undecaprenol N-acetylglucosamine transferase
VARSLQARPARPDLAWIGGHRGLEAQVVPESGIPLRRLALRSLRTVDMNVHAVLDPIRLAVSVPQAFLLLLFRRPKAIFTTGGYVAVPVLICAWLLRIPVVMWEGNVVPGRSVRWTARLARCLAVSFEAACETLASRKPCYATGTPIRGPAEVDRQAARARLGVGPNERLLLIFGGSQAVRRFNLAVADALPRLVAQVGVVHVTGDAGYEEALATREALAPHLRERYRPERFMRDEMADALAAADVVVGRAGSSTLAEAAAFGLPMIVVPYPHAAGHQRRNAEEMAQAGAARLVEDGDFGADTLLAAAAIAANQKQREAMAAAARSLARPGAAAAVAALVMAAAERRPFPPAAEIDVLARGAAT